MRKYALTLLACIVISLVWANDNHDRLAKDFFRLYFPEQVLTEFLNEGLGAFSHQIDMQQKASEGCLPNGKFGG